MDLSSVAELFDETSVKVPISSVCLSLADNVRPWTDLESQAAQCCLSNDADSRTKYLKELWSGFDQMSPESQSRRRIFIGIIAPDPHGMDSCSAEMLIDFALEAGVRAEDILASLMSTVP